MEEGVLANRELAGLILLGAFVAFVLSRPGRNGILSSARDALSSLMKPVTLTSVLLYIGWIAAVAAGGARFGLWRFDLLKTTILWLLLTGFALVMRLNDAIKKPGFFREAAIKTLGIVAFIEFVAALKSFPLWLEIPAQAVAFAFVGVTVIAKGQQHAPVPKLANGYLAIFGLSALIWSTVHLIGNWASLDHGRILREFLLPIWLTPFALFFVYGFAVLAAHQSAFSQMGIWHKEEPQLRHRLAVMLRANGRLASLRLVSGPRAGRIADTDTFQDAWRAVGEVLADAQRRPPS